MTLFLLAQPQVSSISSPHTIRLAHASIAEDTLHFTPHRQGSVGDFLTVLGMHGETPLGDLFSDHWWRQVQVVDGRADGQAG